MTCIAGGKQRRVVPAGLAVDVINRGHDVSSRLAVVQAAREVYEELLERQDTLVVSTDDAEMIQTLLERVRARLKFLS